ncbi:MAG: diguanylate cyclase [Novosphingobium sp.]|nr:diguanylate cyclase [Novosphingobium sp.]
MSAIPISNGQSAFRPAKFFSPFTCAVPERLRDAVVELQHGRLHAVLPVLCLTLAANAIAMTLAVRGDLPFWQQYLPPAIIIASTLAILVMVGLRPRAEDTDHAYRQLRSATWISGALGLVAGIWCVNAFRETEQYLCVVAPVFIALSALVSANCLSVVPRASIAAMAMALGPIIVRMAFYDNIGIRAMAVILVMITLLQGNIALTRFRESVQTLDLQQKLDYLAQSDPLTQLDNRRAFMRKLEERLETGLPATVAIADLDGFKQANDTHGHHAGDAILIEVADRMKHIASTATSISRLGGDEFALLFEHGTESAIVQQELQAIRKAVSLPFVVGKAIIPISTSIGMAESPPDGVVVSDLMQAADKALYRDKAKSKTRRTLRHSVGRESFDHAPEPGLPARRQFRDA